MDITLIRDHIVATIFLCSVIIFQLYNANNHTLLTIIVSSAVIYLAYVYLIQKNSELESKLDNSKQAFIQDVIARDAINESTYAGRRDTNRTLRFLFKNQTMVDIVDELKFVRTFDKMAYADILSTMDYMQQEYVYILTKVYDAKGHIDIFLDTSKIVATLLYRLFFIVPYKLKYHPTVLPHEKINASITKFLGLRARMIAVLKSFCKKELNLPYFPMQSPAAADAPFSDLASQDLP